MKQSRIPHQLLMLLVCTLPLVLFFILAVAGIEIHPLLIPVILILCCFVMFFLMSGVCHHESPERGTRPTPEEGLTAPPQDVHIDDVFRVVRSRREGDVMVLEGELLQPPDEVYEILKGRLGPKEITPLLQEDRDGRPLLILAPGTVDRPVGKDRGPWLNIALFGITLVTTTWAGAWHAGINLLEEPERFTAGLPYSLALMLILGAHELGHYFAARAHNMRVTLPYFIPVPFGLGTFGAFIQLKSPAHTRRALFDVGVAGPLAGLVFAIPALWIGLQNSRIVTPAELAEGIHGGAGVGSSLLFAFTAKLALGESVAQGHLLLLHPLAFAGWLGLLVTALNLLPIGQLDGGHIADAMFGRVMGATIGMVAMFALFILGLFVWSGLLTWAFIVYFLAGGKGLPALNGISRLDPLRFAIGVFAFVLLFLILVPVPHRLYEALGIHCPYL